MRETPGTQAGKKQPRAVHTSKQSFSETGSALSSPIDTAAKDDKGNDQ